MLQIMSAAVTIPRALAAVLSQPATRRVASAGWRGSVLGMQHDRHSKIAELLGINGPNLQNGCPQVSFAVPPGPLTGLFDGIELPKRPVKRACVLPQVFTTYRVAIGRRLLDEARSFCPFTLPNGDTLRKSAASVIVPQQSNPAAPPTAQGNPVAPMPTNPAGHVPAAAATQVLNQFMSPPAAAPIAGLTTGTPQGVPGHAAINSTIQTKGPLSASGDFGNPNAGQDVPMSGGGMKMSAKKYPRLSRLSRGN
jgi:hypothetical protein